MTNFPEDYDSDLEIPRVDNNVSEISGDAINAIRDAVFAIQQVIGINPQGNKTSFNSRVNVSIDANGYLKKAAVEQVGLVSLPVEDRHIGDDASILETKLDLEYGTKQLKNWIDSLRVDVEGVLYALNQTSSASNTHMLGQGHNHDGYQIQVSISGNTIAGLEATTIGDAINEIGTFLLSGNDIIEPHIDLNIPSSVKHAATGISVNTDNFGDFIDRTSANVQEAFDSLASSAGALGISHTDDFHANGIFKTISSSETYDERRVIISNATGSYSAGGSIITIPSFPGFHNFGVEVGDILIVEGEVADAGSYQIRAVGPITNDQTLGGLPVLDSSQIAVFGMFSATNASATVSVAKPSDVSTEFAPLACAVRNNETIVDTVSVLDPRAARVVSLGFNGEILNYDGYGVGIKVGIGNDKYRQILIEDLNLERLGTNQPETINSQSVAERINAVVSDPDLGHHFPITAYKVGEELAIAHNLVGEEYTIEITTDGYIGNYALGFSEYGSDVEGQKIRGNTSKSYSVNGIMPDGLKTTFSGYGRVTTDTDTLYLYDTDWNMINPLEYGIKAGSVIHITDHPTVDTNGSYTIYTSSTTSVSLFSPETIDAPTSPTTFSVVVGSSQVSFAELENSQTNSGLAQIFVDSNGETHLHQRLFYGNGMGVGVEIVDITDTFPSGETHILVTSDGDRYSFNLISNTISGDTINIHNTFKGKFNLYHPNGIDFLVVRIVAGGIIVGLETITVDEQVVLDQSLILGTFHFNGNLSITSTTDERLFGSLGPNQIRDDFIELFCQKPTSDLRSDGVVRGLDLMNVIYIDSVTQKQALPISGGIVYVGGVRISVESQKVIVSSYDEEGSEFANIEKIVGINDFGTLQVFTDELGEILSDGYSSSSAYGKILPLYKVKLYQGIIDEVIDIRRFINNLDEKIDVIVDETNNVVGSFRSLEGALLYAEKYPGHERLTIKILGDIHLSSAITIPECISIVGELPYGGNGKTKIINDGVLDSNLITLNGNNLLRDIEVLSDTAELQGALVYINGHNVVIERCSLKFGDLISTNTEDIGILINTFNNISIIDNKITNIFTGIMCGTGSNNLLIKDNIISQIAGIGASSGIYISNLIDSARVDILNNRIEIDSVSSTDIIGIQINIQEGFERVRIEGNYIFGALTVNSDNYVSNGIRIENTEATGNTISNLVVKNNEIHNVALRNSNVHGMYFSYTDRLLVENNVIDNTGYYDANYHNTSYIWLDTDIGFAKIDGNSLLNGGAKAGIYVALDNTNISISNNILKNIGELDATYIHAIADRTNITNNKLIGPGEYGIRCQGDYSKISTNHMVSSDPTNSYAFRTGISGEANYLDVDNNTLADMNYESSIGIANGNSTYDGLKITNNTIMGKLMYALIYIYGDYHAISGNTLKNDQISATGNTYFVLLDSGSESISILGNTFTGVSDTVNAIGKSYIYSTGAVTKINILNNIMTDTTPLLTDGPIMLSNSSTANCVIMGNRFPSSDLYSTPSEIGPSPTYGADHASTVFNQNLFGINRGLLDTRGIHACEGITAYHSGGDPLWVFNQSGSYWEVNKTDTEVRYLYMPISGIPNGSRLVSVEIQGRDSAETPDTFTAQIYKKSVKYTGLPETTISSAKDMTAGDAEFGNDDDIGLVTVTEDDEIINYEENNYFVKIAHELNSLSAPEDVRIYGMTITFRY